jgi:hypothetical protein
MSTANTEEASSQREGWRLVKARLPILTGLVWFWRFESSRSAGFYRHGRQRRSPRGGYLGGIKALRTSLWVTVGTGVGGGLILDGKPLHGFAHTEMGHIRVPHDLPRDPYRGFHARDNITIIGSRIRRLSLPVRGEPAKFAGPISIAAQGHE